MSTSLGHSKCNFWRTGADFAKGGHYDPPPDKVGLNTATSLSFEPGYAFIFKTLSYHPQFQCANSYVSLSWWVIDKTNISDITQWQCLVTGSHTDRIAAGAGGTECKYRPIHGLGLDRNIWTRGFY